MSAFHSATSANIAFHGGPGEGSHFFVAATVGLELARRGHNVTGIISGDYAAKLRGDSKYASLRFESTNQATPPDILDLQMDIFSKAAVSGDFIGELMRNKHAMHDSAIANCDALLIDHEFIQRLKAAEFDMLIMDPWMGCALILPEILGTRYVLLTGTAIEEHVASAFGSPVNLAVHPAQGSGLPQIMTFWQRMQNVLQSKAVPSLISSLVGFVDDYRRLRNVFPSTSTWETLGRAELLLVNMDFAVEFPVAVAPNVIPVGGITTTPANQLPEDVEEFIQSSGDAGIIVFSFGSYATFMKDELIVHFAEAFSRLPQKVIWKFVGDRIPDAMKSPQFKIMQWLPQNDLLAHTKTRAVVFHGGNNGFYELIDHGVPSVVIPLLVDQFDVASRIVHHQIGIRLDFSTLDADKITEAVRAVIEEDRFKQNAKKISAIFHDRNPTRPVEKAAFWVEHVIKYGGHYMKSPINELTWYQYYLIDVYAAIVLVAALILVILLFFLKMTWRLACFVCCRRKGKYRNKLD